MQKASAVPSTLPPAQIPVLTDPGSVVTIGGVTYYMPLNPRDVMTLRIREQALNAQMSTLSRRRTDVAQQLRIESNATNQAGLQNQLVVINKEIVQLESDLDQ